MSPHETHQPAWRMRTSSNRTFGLVFTAFFLIVGLLPLLRGLAVRPWALVVSGAFLLAALAVPGVLGPLNRAWMLVGLVLHKVTNPIVLGALFFGVLTPLGVLRRLQGHDALRLKSVPEGATYWIARVPPGPPPDSIIRQF